MSPAGQYTYHQLASKDFGRLKDLLRVFGEAFEDVDSYQRAVPSDGYLRRLLAKEHFIALAAMDGNEVVGGLAAYQLDKFEQDRREIYIYDLAVAESHRRKGVATGLIDTLRGIAAERDVYVIFVQADVEDDPGHRAVLVCRHPRDRASFRHPGAARRALDHRLGRARMPSAAGTRTGPTSPTPALEGQFCNFDGDLKF